MYKTTPAIEHVVGKGMICNYIVYLYMRQLHACFLLDLVTYVARPVSFYHGWLFGMSCGHSDLNDSTVVGFMLGKFGICVIPSNTDNGSKTMDLDLIIQLKDSHPFMVRMTNVLIVQLQLQQYVI